MSGVFRVEKYFTRVLSSSVSLVFTIELASLNLFLFFLPLLEAPKNIFAFLYILSATINLVCKKRWTESERLLIFFTAIIILTTLLAGSASDILPLEQRLRNSLYWLTMPILCSLFIVRGYSYTEKKQLLSVFCISMVVLILEAFYQNTNSLRSVGHPNQSALFATTAYVILVWLVANQRSIMIRLMAVVAIFLTIIFIIRTSSLLSVGLVIIVSLSWMLSGVRFKRSRWLHYIMIFIVASISLVALFGKNLEIHDKMKSRLESSSMTSHRIELLNSYRLFFDDHFLLGWGVGSFKQVVTEERVKAKLNIATGDQWHPISRRFHFSQHAHNFYGQILIERGLIGLIVIVAYVATIMRALPSKRDFSLITPLLIIFFCGGLFQTTLHAEHGILGLWALCLAAKPSIAEGF